MKELIYRAFPIQFEGKAMELRVFCETLDACSQYISAYKSIDHLDYFKLYSKYYIPLSDQLRTLPDQNTFLKRLSFSIDLQNIDPRKIVRNLPL